MARFFAYLLQRRIVWKSLAILVLEVAIVIALRKYQQQGIFVCIFRSGTKDCVELTQELLRTNLT